MKLIVVLFFGLLWTSAGAQQPLFCHAAIKASSGYHPNNAGLADGYFMWNIGQTLHIKFLSGSPPLRQKIINIARKWEQYANIHFKFVDSGESHIRINLQADGFIDAPLGTIANIYPPDEANVQMDTSGFTSSSHANAVVLHLFGHILGLHHENEMPLNGRKWDRYAMLDYFSDHGWSEEQVDERIIQPYSVSVSDNIKVDKASVMYIHFPTSWVNEKQGTFNQTLSERDKALIRIYYPQRDQTKDDLSFSVTDFKGFRIKKAQGGIAFYPVFNISISSQTAVFAVMIYDSTGVAIPSDNRSYAFDADLAVVKIFPAVQGKYQLNKTSNDFGFFLPSFEIPGAYRGQKLKVVFRIEMEDYDRDKKQTYHSKPYDLVWDQ